MLRLREITEQGLKELGWNLDYQQDRIVLTKPTRETSMAARVDLVKDGQNYILTWMLYTPSKEETVSGHTAGQMTNHYKLTAISWLERVVFGTLEAALSNNTRTKKIADLYYEFKEPDHPNTINNN
jgi:hypothetical protein